MTMSVLKGQFSFPLTSYTKERKASISGAHGENRENRMLCMSSTAIQCNIKTRPSNLSNNIIIWNQHQKLNRSIYILIVFLEIFFLKNFVSGPSSGFGGILSCIKNLLL